MAKRTETTCNDCFFRRAELCAIPGNCVCPTFRPAKGTLEPPKHPSLVPRTLRGATATTAAA